MPLFLSTRSGGAGRRVWGQAEAVTSIFNKVIYNYLTSFKPDFMLLKTHFHEA